MPDMKHGSPSQASSRSTEQPASVGVQSFENVLEEALRITGGGGARRADYGSALDDAERVARIASAITGHDIKPEHIPLIMVAVKLSRQVNRPKRDNLVDIAGYARVAEMLFDELRDRAELSEALQAINEAA